MSLDIKSAIVLGGSGGGGGADPRVTAISNALQMNAGGIFRKSLTAYKEVPKYVYNKNSGGKYGPDNNYGHAYFTITGGAKLYITGSSASNSGAHPLASFYDAEQTLLGVAGTDKSTTYTDYEVTAPEGAVTVIVNKIYYTQTIKVDMEVPSSGSDTLDDIDQDIDTLQAQVTKLIGTEDAGVVPGETITPTQEVPRSLYNVIQKKTYGDQESYAHNFYSVTGEAYYYVSGSAASSISQYPLCAFYDSDGNYLDSFGLEANKVYTDELIQAPKDSAALVVNKSRSDAHIEVKKGIVTDEDETTYPLNIADALIREAKKNPFKLAQLDKGYVTFVFDDLCTDLDSIASIFEEYNYPLGIAAIPDRLDIRATYLQETRGNFTPNMKMREIMAQVVRNGGEIMTHNQLVVTADNQDDTNFMNDYFVKSKQILTASGFNVRGLIRAGGTGAISRTPQIERWLIGNYEYSNIGTAENYALDRTTINKPVADVKAAILDAQTNGTWLRFMCHGYEFGGGETFTGEADLREILDYCQTLGIPVVTYATMIDRFGSSLVLELAKTLS